MEPWCIKLLKHLTGYPPSQKAHQNNSRPEFRSNHKVAGKKESVTVFEEKDFPSNLSCDAVTGFPLYSQNNSCCGKWNAPRQLCVHSFLRFILNKTLPTASHFASINFAFCLPQTSRQIRQYIYGKILLFLTRSLSWRLLCFLYLYFLFEHV